MPITEVSPLAPSPSTEEVVASDLIAQEQQKRRDFMQRQVLQQKAGQTGLLRTAAMDALDLNPMTWSFNGGDGRIFDSFRARVGTGMYQAVATTLDRRNVDQNVDAEFNPYGFIRDNPTVFKNDPLIDTMVERGQFDGSHNIDQFWYDYTDAKRFFDQQQQIETDWKNGHYLRNVTTWAASLVLDPVNMVPLAFAGKGVSFLRGSAQSAGGVAALSLASKKILDAGQPVANEPGLSDEAMALVEGAIVGGGLHGLVAGAGMALKTDTARKILDRVAKSDKRTLAATFEAKANELEATRSAEVWTPEQAQSGESLVPAEQPIKNEAPAGTTPVAVDELATMDSAGSQVAPQSDSTPPTVVSFKTSKGSEYFVEGTTTTRNKSYHPEHGSADVGMKPRSLRTVYVNEEAQFEASSAMGLNPESQPSVKIEGDELVVRYKSGRDNARNLIQREKRFPISSTPEKGMAPIEFLEGSRVHVGNEITEISTAPAAQPPTPALPKPVASTGRAYSNADLERRIFDHAQSNSAELEAIASAQARAASVSEGRRVSEQVNLQMDDTQIPSAGRKFRGKIPEELLNEMSTPEDRKILRRAVSVVVDSETGGMLKELPGDGIDNFGNQIKSAKDKSPIEVGTVGGDDLLSSIGAEAYANILREEAAGRSVSATISQMRMSNDPRSQLLVYLYDNRLATNRTKEANTYKTWFDDNGVFHKELVKKGEVKVAKEGELGYVPAKDSFKADEIPVGATFKINGEVFNVIEDEHGFRVMRDGAEFPLDALDEIPIDRKGKKGTSLRMMTPEEIAATRIKKAENGPLTPAENAAVNDLLENELLDYWAALEMSNKEKRDAIYAEYGDEFAPQAATFDNDPLTEDELLTVSDLVGIDNLRKYSNAELRRFLSGDNLPGSVGAATATEIHTPKQMHPESVANSIRATYRELEWHLQQTPVDNTNIVVTAIPGDKAWSLIEQLKAKYEAAGKTLIVHQSNEQPLYELFRVAADFAGRQSDLIDALPKDFAYGGIDTAAANVSTRIVDWTTSFLTVNGRLGMGGRELPWQTAMLGRISDVWKTVSGSSMTVPTGSAKDPFGFRWGTSAENFKLVLEAKMTQAKKGIIETYKRAQRNNETITFGDRTLNASRTNFGGATQFAEMVSEYAHQVQAKANGLTDKGPHANTSPVIKEAYKHVRGYFDEHLAMMVDTGMLKSNQAIKDYFSAMWKIDRVKADPVGFKFALEQEYRRVEAMKNGVQLPPEERPIVSEAAKNVRDALMPLVEHRVNARTPLLPKAVIDEATFLKELSQMTEGELRGDGLSVSMMDQQVFIRGAEAYEQSVRKFYREAAEKAYASLTNRKDPQAIPTDGRTMRIDYSRMQPWMETNPLVVMDRYHHVVGGRLAVRRSIQLNPEVWGTSYLKDGTRVNDGATMKQYIGEMIDAMDMAASHADSLNGVTIDKAGGKGTKLAEVANLRSVVYADIAALIDKVEGRTQLPNEGEFADLFNSGLRTVRRATVLNLMNSQLVQNVMDVAGIGMVRFVRDSSTMRFLTGMARSVEAISKKDLAPMLAQIERAAHARSLGDIDVNDVVMGHSAARRTLRGAENATIKMVDWQQKISFMDWWTRTIKQIAGHVAIETAERNVRKMIRAYTEHTTAPSKGGIDAAMRKAGIDGYDARRTNFLVGNIQEMQTFADQVFEHGVLDNGRRVKSEMTRDEFLRTKKRITPNFHEWDSDVPSVRDLLDKVQGNLAGEVNHRLNVTPGAGDQPRWATGRGTFAEIGKMGTQFLNFGMAQSNQMFRTVAQQPFLNQANFTVQMFGLAALAGMIAAYLAGRRTPTQTLELWQKNPLGMAYDTVDRGGFVGILGKPLGVLDSLGSPYTPGNFLKAMPDQTATRRKITDKTQLIGPSAEYAGKWWDVLSGAASGRLDQQLAYNTLKLLPYQNLWWLRLLNRTTGLPVVPESIRPPSNTPQQQPRV